MSDVVDPNTIEGIVGIERNATIHFGRIVPAEERFYILHSQECFDTRSDLRECPFSQALDRGIDPDEWPEDRPVMLDVVLGWLTMAEEAQ